MMDLQTVRRVGMDMKRQGIFPGIILIGIGLYFLLEKFNLPYMNQLLSWPTILIIIGLAFLMQSNLGEDSSSIFPGTLLLLLGIHFHAQDIIIGWPSHWAMYTLIVGLSFLFYYLKTKKDGLIIAIILIVISLIGFFSKNVFDWVFSIFGFLGGFWPIILIAIGIFLIVKRK